MENKDCQRIKLAGAEGCNIIYCEDCKVTELVLGAISVRLELNALYNLQSVLALATRKLSVLKSTLKHSDVLLNHADLH